MVSPLELRTINKAYSKDNKRQCKTCGVVHTGIKENFCIKKYHNNNPVYETQCKQCNIGPRAERTEKYRNDYKQFITSKISAYRYRAKECNVEFNLTAEYLIEIFEKQNGKCFYTHKEISFTNTVIEKNRPHNLTPSIDRLNPDKGYVEGNVVWSCYYINRMKSDVPYDEFISLCELILQNQKR